MNKSYEVLNINDSVTEDSILFQVDEDFSVPKCFDYVLKIFEDAKNNNPRSPIVRYGGKFELKDLIISLFPEHDFYIETCGGAGHILQRKERSLGEVYNDIDEEICNFFKVVQDDNLRKKLEWGLYFTLYSREEFNMANKVPLIVNGVTTEYTYDKYIELKKCVELNLKYESKSDITIVLLDDEVERARKFFIRNLQSFNGLGKNWRSNKSSSNSRRGMAQCVSSWLNHVERDIEPCGIRLQGVVIEILDIIDLINKYDCKDTLFYIDTPYVHLTRVNIDAYDYEMTDKQHENLVEILSHVQGKVIISGYDNEIYQNKLVQELGWNKIKLGDYAKRSSTSETKSEGEEIVWFNYDLETGEKLQIVK